MKTKEHQFTTGDSETGLLVDTGFRHRLVVVDTGQFEIATDTPYEARALEDDTYTLKSTDAGFEQTLSVANDSKNVDGFAVLEFIDVPRRKAFTLEVTDEDGTITLLRRVPYRFLDAISSCMDGDSRHDEMS